MISSYTVETLLMSQTCASFKLNLPASQLIDSRSVGVILLQVFKRHNPAMAEEQEMMENLFDALCSCLMLAANRDRFLRGEGLQLMNLMLR